jgi:hypothetical protein
MKSVLRALVFVLIGGVIGALAAAPKAQTGQSLPDGRWQFIDLTGTNDTAVSAIYDTKGNGCWLLVRQGSETSIASAPVATCKDGK